MLLGCSSAIAQDSLPYSYADMVELGITQCRQGAAGLRQQAQICRNRMAAEKDVICTVTETRPDGSVLREYNVAQADARAALYDAHSRTLEPHVLTLRRIERQIQVDRKHIKELGFDKRDEEFAALENIVRTQQQDYEKLKLKTLDAAISTVLTALKAGGTYIPALTKSEAERIIWRIKQARINSPDFEWSIRRVQAARGKELTKAWQDWLELTGRLRELPDIPEKDVLPAIATVLSWGIKDPRLSVLVNELDSATAAVIQAVDGRINSNAIERLMRLNERDLKLLTIRMATMKKHFADLRDEMSKIKGCGRL